MRLLAVLPFLLMLVVQLHSASVIKGKLEIYPCQSSSKKFYLD